MTTQATILKYLNLCGTVTGKNIHKHLQAKGYDISQRKMRLYIVELQDKQGYLIKGGRRGYTLVKNHSEYQEAIKYYTKYIKSLSRKIIVMKRNYKRMTAKLFKK